MRENEYKNESALEEITDFPVQTTFNTDDMSVVEEE